MPHSRRWTPRLLALAGVVAAALTVLTATPARAYIPECGAIIRYYSDFAKTNEVGRCDVTPSECGCVEHCYGSYGNYYSWVPLTYCF